MQWCHLGEHPLLPPIARGVQTSDLADHSPFSERMVMHVYACVCVMIVIGGLLALGLTVLLGSRAERRVGTGRDCAEGGADGTQIVLFGVPGDCGSGLPGSACTGPRQRGLLGPVTSGCLAVARWLPRAEKAETWCSATSS